MGTPGPRGARTVRDAALGCARCRWEGAGGRDRGGARAAFIPPSSSSCSLPPPPPGARSPSRERAAGGRMLQTAAEAGGWAGRAGGAGAAIRRGVGTAVVRAKLWEEGNAPGGSEEQSWIRAGVSGVPGRNAPLRCPSPSRPFPRRSGAGSAVPRGGRAGAQPQLRCPTRKASGREGNLFRGARREPRLQPLSSCRFRLTARPGPAGCEASPGHGVPVCAQWTHGVQPTRGCDRGQQLGLRAACRGGREPSGMAWPVWGRGCGHPSVPVTVWHSRCVPLPAVLAVMERGGVGAGLRAAVRRKAAH